VRTPDSVFRTLIAEEHLFKPVAISDLLRTSRVLDILNVTFLS
jgi:hypothetical protein